ncbi:MAG: hypothetical protein IJO61_02320, partial [Oscillospiraceae bacterium]|nr:hypothetical protein [Oscillospiraceae bacterium]
MNRFMKKTGAVFAMLCLIVSLMPGVSFATDSGAVTIDFTNTETTQFAVLTGKSSSVSYRNFGAQGFDPVYQFQIPESPWISGATENTGKITLEISLGTTEAGWYDISMTGAKWYCAGSWYIYVNGQYAGFYNCCGGKASASLPVIDSPTKLNTLYLTPDENGKVELMFALVEQGKNADFTDVYGSGRLEISSMTFTPVDAPDFTKATVASSVTIPDDVTVGTQIPYSASVVMEDGSTRYINGYTADRTADTENTFGISMKSGSGIKAYEDYIESTCAGPVKFSFAAKVNGVA